MRILAATPFIFVALTAAAWSGQVHVPGDFASIQAAIDNSPANTTIVVHGGTHPEIVVTKPVQLIGDPQFEIKNWGYGPNYEGLPGIQLSGSGSGVVRIVRAKLSNLAFTSTFASAAPAITGGGFEQLQVLHSNVRGADGCCDESINGGAGIDTTVPYVVVSDSTVAGGNNNHDVFGNGYGLPAGIGIRAPQSTVVLLDSTVLGGDVPDTGFVSFAGCPTCSGISFGDGATGVVVQRLFRANSVVSGGHGGKFSCYDPSTDQSTPICTKANGTSIVAGQQFTLGGYLVSSGPIDVGGSWTLTMSTQGPGAALLLSSNVVPPIKTGPNWLFLDPSSVLVVPLSSTGLASLVFAVPQMPALAGLAVGAQVYEAATGLTRPIVAGIVP